MPHITVVDSSQLTELRSAFERALDGGAPILPAGAESWDAAIALAESLGLVPDDIALVIRTSGSLGAPRAVGLTGAALRASAAATAQALGGHGQWLLALSPHVIAGAQILVRSVLAGTAPTVVQGHFAAEAFVAAADELSHERRYTSLVPLQLARLMEALETDDELGRRTLAALRRFDAVLIGGQRLPGPLAARAESLGIRIVRTYGSTETAGGCVYDGVPIGDTTLRLEDGELWISGSALATGYLDQPELTEERFITRDGARWFATRDAAELRDGHLHVLGRLDNVFVSGGVNVSLDAIERLVHEHPGWGEAVAIAVPNATWGERCVLVSTVASGDLAALQTAIREQLGAPAVPLEHRVLPEVPKLTSGKPDRRALTAALSDAGPEKNL